MLRIGLRTCLALGAGLLLGGMLRAAPDVKEVPSLLQRLKGKDPTQRQLAAPENHEIDL